MSEYDVFLSHSEQDGDLINKIARALIAIGLYVYIEEYEKNFGSDMVDSVCEAIDESDCFLVVLTDKSIKSQWVNNEIGYAYARDTDIIPVRFGEVKVSGMIGTIKGIRSKDDEELLIHDIVNYFIDEYNKKYFKVFCEKCGDDEEWELPGQEDYYNWDNKNRPMNLKCDCGHFNKINPITLLPMD